MKGSQLDDVAAPKLAVREDDRSRSAAVAGTRIETLPGAWEGQEDGRTRIRGEPEEHKRVGARTGFDGEQYELVFSDEFNLDGRSFYPGDDPYWEAVDLWYGATQDLEWYDPQAAVTKDGKLVITMSEVKNHDLNFQSGA